MTEKPTRETISEDTTSLPAYVTISKDILSQDLEGEMLVLDLQSDHYYSLDEAGARIWCLLSEQSNTGLVIDRLLEEYDTTEARISQELAALLDQLAAAGLITIMGTGSVPTTQHHIETGSHDQPNRPSKKEFVSPEFKELGHLVELTQGGANSMPEPGFGSM